jgi:hypothetical protein
VEPAVPAEAPVVAKLILDEWWGRQEPKPQQRYVGALQVVKKALADGWQEPDLREALDSIPIISGGALDIWRKKRTTTRRPAYGTGSKSAAQIADESMGRLTRLMGLDR